MVLFFPEQVSSTIYCIQTLNYNAIVIKAYFPLGEFVHVNTQKVGTVPTCLQRIFLPANFNQSHCRILVFALRRANKVAKWKIGLK